MAEFTVTFKEQEHTSEFDIDLQSDDNLDVGFESQDEFFFNTITENINIVDAEKHNDLRGRSESDAHPISAISGLEEKLSELEKGTVTQSERTYWNNKSRVFRNASGSLVIST